MAAQRPDAYRERKSEQIGAALRAQIGCERPDVLIAGRQTFAWHVPDVSIASTVRAQRNDRACA